MSQKDKEALVIFIILVIVGLGIIILKLLIAFIHFCQNMFWITLLLIPILLLTSIIFLIWGLLRDDSFVDYDEFFERPIIFVLAGGLIVLCLICIISTPYFYENGYSDEALQNLAIYENELQSLQQLQNILTGQIIWDIQNQVIEETINNLCQDPTYPCEQTKQNYQVYKDIKGAKDDADQIANFFGFVENVSKEAN